MCCSPGKEAPHSSKELPTEKPPAAGGKGRSWSPEPSWRKPPRFLRAQQLCCWAEVFLNSPNCLVFFIQQNRQKSKERCDWVWGGVAGLPWFRCTLISKASDPTKQEERKGKKKKEKKETRREKAKWSQNTLLFPHCFSKHRKVFSPARWWAWRFFFFFFWKGKRKEGRSRNCMAHHH